MPNPISIHKDGRIIELQPGIYRVKVIGSWFMSVGNFSISLRELATDKIINWNRTKFGTFDYALNQNARNVGTINFPKWSKYSIHFENQENIIVTKMGQFGLLSLLLNKTIPNSEIKIVIG